MIQVSLNLTYFLILILSQYKIYFLVDFFKIPLSLGVYALFTVCLIKFFFKNSWNTVPDGIFLNVKLCVSMYGIPGKTVCKHPN